MDRAKATTQAEIGLAMDVRPTLRMATAKSPMRRRCTVEVLWHPRGSPRAIRVHANRDETLVFPIDETHGVNHAYSDAAQLSRVPVSTYALEEVVAE